MKRQCSVVRKRFKTSSYCGACYHALDISFDSETRKQMAHMKRGKKGGHPLLGCLKCNEIVCKGCWSTYDHYLTHSNKGNKNE